MKLSTVAWLTQAERNPLTLTTKGTLAEAVTAFQRDTDLRLLPIVDHVGCPVGAIFEKDVRRLLLNPFGHALLQNPTIGANLAEHIRHCPVHEAVDEIGLLVEHYRTQDGREGMILTRAGRMFATLSNRRLLMLAGEQESRAQAARIDRARRIEEAGLKFQVHSGTLANQMIQLSDTVQRLAGATVNRSAIADERATSVASVMVQTRDTMAVLAERGEGLAEAFAAIEHSLSGARMAADTAVGRVTTGAARARRLLDTTQSIDAVMTLIGKIAGTVNLLSLNASIEAARAGEAGRGFAVVANEVKNLSLQTHDATQEISTKIQALRGGVAEVATDYAEMERAISSMARAGADIDQAILREAATTRMIATTVGEASDAAHSIESAVQTIVHSAGSASASARDLDRLANDLRQGASALGDGVMSLLAELRAA